MRQTVLTAAGICVASWIGLFLGAGNIGLQRAVSIGPLTLLEQPLAMAISAGLAFAVALRSARTIGATQPLALVAWILTGDVIGAVVLAPIMVGELTPFDAPVVFAALAVLGLQPLAALVGSLASRAFQST